MPITATKKSKTKKSSNPSAWFNSTNFTKYAKSWGWTPSQISAASKALKAFFASWNSFNNGHKSHSNGFSSTSSSVKPKTRTQKIAGSKTPSSSPNFAFDWSKKGRCTIYFGTNPTNPRTNKFPTGVKNVTLQFRISSGNWKTIAKTSKPWFTQVVSTPTPKSLQYRACYVTSTGKKGPWSTVTPTSYKVAA